MSSYIFKIPKLYAYKHKTMHYVIFNLKKISLNLYEKGGVVENDMLCIIVHKC